MEKHYVLGVDGGNTKTDYILYTTKGELVSHFRGGTCSHEAFEDGYNSTRRIMKETIMGLLKENNIQISDIKGAAFGLAGVDLPVQQQKLEEIIRELGFNNFAVSNDSLLGIKAVSKDGIGVCSINGTGTVAGGIDKNGTILQVGGIGDITGDEAGGGYITRKALRAVYDSLYRCYPETMLRELVFSELNISLKEDYVEAIHSDNLSTKFKDIMTPIIKEVFRCANEGDEASINILSYVGEQLARSVGGCIKNLEFTNKVDVVMAGSIWVKSTSPIMFNTFKEKLSMLTDKELSFITLQEPPAIGAVLWALELYYGNVISEELRKKIRDSIKC